MGEPFGDARIEELKLLSEIHRKGVIAWRPEIGHWRDLAAYLVDSRFVNDLHPGAWDHGATVGTGGLPGETPLERKMHSDRIDLLSRLLAGQEIHLKLTHRGRVRLSELRQVLRSGREREPFGILWDVRHWEQDVQIAILACNEPSPLALAYLDMNGLKDVNTAHGHDGGDLALKSYFQTVSSVLGDRGQAYRLSGGADEVLAVLPDQDEQAAVRTIALACKKLMNERLWQEDKTSLLSLVAGVVTTTDPTSLPTKLRAAADAEQNRAKDRSKQNQPRPSVIAVSGKEEMIVIEHNLGNGGSS